MHHQMKGSSPKDTNMTGKLFIVLTVLSVDLSPCLGQYGGEMAAAMEGMMGGGLGAMMGAGGMGGLGAMMGAGGMGGLGSMMGSGGMGGMGAGIGAMIRQGARASAMNSVTEAVHFIVGPQASPDQPLIAYAMAQRSPPRNMMQMLAYLPHMQRIARTMYGPWLAQMATQNPNNTSSTTAATGTAANPAIPTTAGKSLVQLNADLDTVVMQRSIEYMNRPQTQQAATGAGAMAAMGAMIPAMIQGITAQYM